MEIRPLIELTVGGTLGALTNIALGPKTIVLPRRKGRCLHLGFIAQLIICIGVAHVVDHNLQTAYLSSLCGVSVMRAIKRRIERTFEGLTGEMVEEPEDE